MPRAVPDLKRLSAALGLALLCSLLPASALASGSVTEFPLPSSHLVPASITTGPDGRLWFTQAGVAQLGIISTSGVFSAGPALSAPGYGIAAAAGDIWVTEPSAHIVARVTAAGVVTEFAVTKGHYPMGIAAGPDGNVWFTESGNPAEIGRITPTGTITYFDAALPGASAPLSIVTGADGDLWFTQSGPPAGIGRITPSGVVTEFPTGPPPGNAPEWITAGPDGNLWFTESGPSPQIGRITPSGTITQFSTGLSAAATDITAGPNGNLWFTEASNPGRIGEITPAGAITEIATPTVNSAPAGITTGPDGRLWFTESADPGAIGVTGMAAPVATTGVAASVGQTTATLTGTVDPNGSATTYEFQWGTSTTYGSLAPTTAGTVGDDSLSHTLSTTLTGLTPGTTYHYRLVATDCNCASGTSYGTDVSFTTQAQAAGGAGPSTTGGSGAGTTAAPVPTIGKTATLSLGSGTALVRVPGSKRFVKLGASGLVPVGSVIEVTHGAVRLTTALKRSKQATQARAAKHTQTVRIWGGRFSFHQSPRSSHVTLELVGRPVCAGRGSTVRSGRVLSARARKTHPTKLPALWSQDNHGKYSTRGLNSVATVRGTIWKTVETCAGTLTYVRKGVVSVRNLHSGRSQLVTAGHRLLVANGSDASARHR